MDIRLPNINANTDREQLQQIRSYLYQFAEQMQWAIENLEKQSSSVVVNEETKQSSSASSGDKIENFNQIKSLIIKSADIVNSFYEQIETRLDSSYVAVSDFGTYKEQNTAVIQATAQGITQSYTTAINLAIDDVQSQIDETNAYIRTGQLDTDGDGNPIYGLEIGQKSTVGGSETFNRYARFTSNRLSFYDAGGAEVAYISDYKLYITNVQITDTLILGGYRMKFNTNGIYYKWIGR